MLQGDRPPWRGRSSARDRVDRRGPALGRRGDRRPVRGRGGVDRALRPGDGPARLRGRRRRTGPGRHRRRDPPRPGHRRLRLHDRPGPRPVRRGERPPVRTSRGRADRLRPALDRRGAARRRPRHDRRPRGARQARARRRSRSVTSSSPRVFARQAAVAIRASRVERDLGSLLRATLQRPVASVGAALGGGSRRARPGRRPRGSTRRRLPPLGARRASSPNPAAADPDQLELVTDLLGAIARQGERDARARRRGRSAAPARRDRSLTDD